MINITKLSYIKKYIHFYILSSIVLVGLILRFWQFGAIPQGFQVDEAAFGYNAYSLMKTGADEYGTPFPITLRSFNDEKAALYAYVDVPFIAIMGLNPAAVRMPTLILGLLFILLSYAVTQKLTKDKKISLIVATLCAISPTLIFQNRIQSDPMLGTFLVVLGLYLFLLWVENKRWVILLASFIVWGLSLIAYQSPRVFLVVFLPFLFWHYRSTIRKKMVFVFGGGYIILFLCIASLTFSGGARLSQTSVFTTPEIKLVLNESIREEGQHTSPLITRVFDNKLIYYGRALVSNYFSYINFEFLFLQTQSPVRESLQNTGFLYLIELPFLLIGIYQMIRKKLQWGYFIVGWTLLTPLVLSPFTSESPNIHRFLLEILPVEILVGFGISYYFDFIKKNILIFKISLLVIPLIFTVSLIYFLDELFVHQPVHRPWARNYADKALIQQIDANKSRYKRVIVSTSESNVYIFYLFYNKYDPKKYQREGSQGNKSGGHIDNLVFTPSECPLSAGNNGVKEIVAEKDVLFVEDSSCITPSHNISVIANITWGDNADAFKLISYTP